MVLFKDLPQLNLNGVPLIECVNRASETLDANAKRDIHGYAKFVAGDPPTILLFSTFENPHPCSGVSKIPLFSKITSLPN